MSDSLTNEETSTEKPTCVLRWWRDPSTQERRLQQKWLVHRWKTGGAQWTYEEWRDVPEDEFNV